MSYEITCPYCFETMRDDEVHFRSERVSQGSSGILPEQYYDDIRRFIDMYEGDDKEELIRRYAEWDFYREGDDEKYTNFWSRFNGTTEHDPSDEYLGIRAYRRKVIDPSVPHHQMRLRRQEDGSFFIRDEQGMVAQVELATGEKCERRVCCHCHNPLPRDYGKSPQRFVCVIGITGAGKTVYLSQLLRHMRKYSAKVGLSASSSAASNKQFLNNNPIAVGTPLPGSTESARLQQPLFYGMTRNEGEGRKESQTLVLYDVAGEVFTDDYRIQRFAPFIEHADGLLLIIDPMQFEVIGDANLSGELLDDSSVALSAIQNIVSHGNADKKCDLPIAVCVSKVDKPEVQGVFPQDLNALLLQEVQGIKQPGSRLFSPIFNAQDYNPIAKMLDEWVQDNDPPLAMQLETNYSNYSYFAFTTLGCPVKPSEELGGVETPEGPILPKRVEEPILWLFNQLGYIEANAAVYNPAGELLTCPNCGSRDTEPLKGEDAFVEEGSVFNKKRVPVNRTCKSCGYKWYHVSA